MAARSSGAARGERSSRGGGRRSSHAARVRSNRAGGRRSFRTGARPRREAKASSAGAPTPQSAPPQDERTLRVAFIPGVEPDAFRRRWHTVRERAELELIPIAVEEQFSVLEDGAADMVFARVDPEQPRAGSPFPTGLHAIPLWQERAVVVMSVDSELSLLEEITQQDLAGETVFPAERPGDEKQRIEIVETGIGATIMPMSLARHHHRRTVTHRPLVGAPPTQIALIWPRAADDDLRQEFAAVVRGRTARSSRGK